MSYKISDITSILLKRGEYEDHSPITSMEEVLTSLQDFKYLFRAISLKLYVFNILPNHKAYKSKLPPVIRAMQSGDIKALSANISRMGAGCTRAIQTIHFMQLNFDKIKKSSPAELSILMGMLNNFVAIYNHIDKLIKDCSATLTSSEQNHFKGKYIVEKSFISSNQVHGYQQHNADSLKVLKLGTPFIAPNYPIKHMELGIVEEDIKALNKRAQEFSGKFVSGIISAKHEYDIRKGYYEVALVVARDVFFYWEMHALYALKQSTIVAYHDYGNQWDVKFKISVNNKNHPTNVIREYSSDIYNLANALFYELESFER